MYNSVKFVSVGVAEVSWKKLC